MKDTFFNTLSYLKRSSAYRVGGIAFALLCSLAALTSLSASPVDRILIEESFDYGPPEVAGFYSNVIFGAPETSDINDWRTRWQWLSAGGGRLENSTLYGRNTRLLASFDAITLQSEGDYIELSFNFHFMDATDLAGSGFVAGFLDLPVIVDVHSLVKSGEPHVFGGSEGYVFQQQAKSENASLGLARFDEDGLALRNQEVAPTQYVRLINAGRSAEDAVSFRLKLSRTADGIRFSGTHGGDELNPFSRVLGRMDALRVNTLYFSAQAVGGQGGAIDNVKVVTNVR